MSVKSNPETVPIEKSRSLGTHLGQPRKNSVTDFHDPNEISAVARAHRKHVEDAQPRARREKGRDKSQGNARGRGWGKDPKRCWGRGCGKGQGRGWGSGWGRGWGIGQGSVLGQGHDSANKVQQTTAQTCTDHNVCPHEKYEGCTIFEKFRDAHCTPCTPIPAGLGDLKKCAELCKDKSLIPGGNCESIEYDARIKPPPNPNGDLECWHCPDDGNPDPWDNQGCNRLLGTDKYGISIARQLHTDHDNPATHCPAETIVRKQHDCLITSYQNFDGMVNYYYAKGSVTGSDEDMEQMAADLCFDDPKCQAYSVDFTSGQVKFYDEQDGVNVVTSVQEELEKDHLGMSYELSGPIDYFRFDCPNKNTNTNKKTLQELLDQQCGLKKYEDKRCSGGTPWPASTTVSDCERACDGQNTCFGYNWLASGSTCELCGWTASQNIITDPGWHHYGEFCPCESTPAPDCAVWHAPKTTRCCTTWEPKPYERENVITWYGFGDYSSTIHDCAKACKDVFPGCVMFTYNLLPFSLNTNTPTNLVTPAGNRCRLFLADTPLKGGKGTGSSYWAYLEELGPCVCPTPETETDITSPDGEDWCNVEYTGYRELTSQGFPVPGVSTKAACMQACVDAGPPRPCYAYSFDSGREAVYGITADQCWHILDPESAYHMQSNTNIPGANAGATYGIIERCRCASIS